MADEWVLLVPAGVEVTQTVSNAVDEPTLITREQIIALAGAVSAMKAAGIPADIGDLIRARLVPFAERYRDAQPGPQVDHPEPYITPLRRDPEYPCVCGKTYMSPEGLRSHQVTCGTHNGGYLIPREHQVDS